MSSSDTPLFERHEPEDVLDLISQYPLAWLEAAGPRAETSLLMPLLAERDGDGRLVSLLGHVPRSHPVVAALETDSRALILVNGPQGYISPTWVRDRRWAPTWNFAQLRIEAEVRFDGELTGEALARLVDTMEAGRPDRWSVDELGDRYAALASRVIGFRARVSRLTVRFKLGQDERPEILADILARVPDLALAAWMRRFNRGRF